MLRPRLVTLTATDQTVINQLDVRSERISRCAGTIMAALWRELVALIMAARCVDADVCGSGNMQQISSGVIFLDGCIEVGPLEIATFTATNAARDFYIFYISAGPACVDLTFDGSFVAKWSSSDARNIQLGPIECGDTAGTGECCVFVQCTNSLFDCSKPGNPLVYSFSVDPPSASPTPSASVSPSGSFSTGASSSMSSTVSASPSQPTTPTPSSSPTPSQSHTPSSSSSVTPSATATHTFSRAPALTR